MMAVSKLGTQGGGRILDPLLQRNIPPISNSFNDAVTRLGVLFFFYCDYVERAPSSLFRLYNSNMSRPFIRRVRMGNGGIWWIQF
jgi:hypothetical protein